MIRMKRIGGRVMHSLAGTSARLATALLMLMALTWGCSRLNEQAGTPSAIGVAQRDVRADSDRQGEFRGYGYDGGDRNVTRQEYGARRPQYGRYEETSQGRQYDRGYAADGSRGRGDRYWPEQQQRSSEVAQQGGYRQAYDGRDERPDEYDPAESHESGYRGEPGRRQGDGAYRRDYGQGESRIEYAPAARVPERYVERGDVVARYPKQAPVVTRVTVSAADGSAIGLADNTASPEKLLVETPPPASNRLAEAATRAVPAVNIETASHVSKAAAQAISVNPGSQTRPGGIAGAMEQLQEFLVKEPGNVPARMALRCLYLADGRMTEAMDSTLLAELPAAQQGRTHALMQAMLLAARSQYGAEKDNPDIANRALDAVDGLVDQVAQKAELRITAVKVCNKVYDFGRYELVPNEELANGTAKSVIIYCQVQNFQCEKNDAGKFLSRLRAEFTLYDTASWQVLAQRKSDVTDVPSFTRRRDFYLRGEFDMPRLSSGKYQLEVRITDRIANKIAQPKRLDFTVNPTQRPANY